MRDGICCKQRFHRFATSLISKEESVMCSRMAVDFRRKRPMFRSLPLPHQRFSPITDYVTLPVTAGRAPEEF